jgi:hypothetical protein
MILFGVLFVCFGIFLPIIPKFPESADLITDTVTRWILVGTGISYVFWPLYRLWINRKRFPKSLGIEDIEE